MDARGATGRYFEVNRLRFRSLGRSLMVLEKNYGIYLEIIEGNLRDHTTCDLETRDL
jgi:hypothetical protein